MKTTNPFATRFTRPGALAFLFPEGESAASLVDKLAAGGGWGQILGPHGSGKSALIATLVSEMQRRGQAVRLVSLKQGETKLAIDRRELSKGMQLVIDGFEQLSWFWRQRAKSLARGCEGGLLVTAHGDVGLPTLWTMEPSLELAQRVVQRLLPEGDTTISPDDVARAFDASKGSVREMLFSLFDVYRARHS